MEVPAAAKPPPETTIMDQRGDIKSSRTAARPPPETPDRDFCVLDGASPQTASKSTLALWKTRRIQPPRFLDFSRFAPHIFLITPGACAVLCKRKNVRCSIVRSRPFGAFCALIPQRSSVGGLHAFPHYMIFQCPRYRFGFIPPLGRGGSGG